MTGRCPKCGHTFEDCTCTGLWARIRGLFRA